MVIAQARVPVNLGINNWAVQVSLARLLAQVIPGIRTLSHLSPAAQPGTTQVPQQPATTSAVQYTVILQKNTVSVPTEVWEVNRKDTASQLIFLSNDSDSGLQSLR